MKKGKIILGAAAAIVTVGSVLAFKLTNKRSAGKLVFAMTANSVVNGTCPVTCRSLRTAIGPCNPAFTCLTKNGDNIGIGRGSARTFFTSINSAPTGHRTCLTPVICLHKSL